jgi:hypothetical protein
VDLIRDYVRPVRDFEISMRIPAGLEPFDRMMLARPGKEDVDLRFDIVGDRVVFTVPEVRVWAMITFSSGEEQKAATMLTTIRKELRKRDVLGRDNVEQKVAEYKRIFQMYEKRQYHKTITAGQELISSLSPILVHQ